MKRKQIAFLMVLALLAGAFAFFRASSWSNAGQAQDQFEAALAYDPGRYHIVQIEVPRKGGAGYERHCVYAHGLLETIMRESRLTYDATGHAKAIEIALKAPRHRFNFKDPGALIGISGPAKTMEEACAIIATGRPAYQLEYSGELKAGER